MDIQSSISILRLNHFRNLWLAQAVTQFGDAFYYWIFYYTVDAITQCATKVALAAILEMLPYFLISPYAGVLVDRLDRKKVLLNANLATAGLMLILITYVLINKEPSLLILYITMFLLSTINAFVLPARMAAIQLVVPHNKIILANSICMATQNLMPLIGILATAGGLVAIKKGLPNLFFPIGILTNAISYGLAIFFLVKLPNIKAKEDKIQEKPSIIKECFSGMKFVVSKKVLWRFFFIQLIVCLCYAPYSTCYLTANRKWFGGEFSTLRIVEIAETSAMVLGSILVSKLAFKRPSVPYLTGIFILAGCYLGLCSSKVLWVFAVFSAVGGFATPFTEVPLTSYIQMVVPNKIVGRVQSIFLMMTYGMMPVGTLLAGYLLENIGIKKTFVFMGCGLVIAMLIGISNRNFRHAEFPAKNEEL